MPAYNAGRYIRASIESVLNQTYRDFELIIINDGSTDNTEEIIKKYDDYRIVYIHQNNAGVSSARNTGLKKTKGDYITFLDSDDLWIPDKLERQLEFYHKKCSGNIGLVFSNYYFFTDTIEHAWIVDYRDYFNLENTVEKLLIYDFIGTLTVMIKREAFNDIGYFDESLHGPEDWDYWIRVAQKYAIKKDDAFLAYYRENPAGISKNRKNQLTDEERVRLKYAEEMKNYRNIHAISFWLNFRNKMKYCLGNKQLFSALAYYFKSLLYRPFTIRNFLPIK
jgi:glycosyltransferase involved in cell wall biosynthesis